MKHFKEAAIFSQDLTRGTRDSPHASPQPHRRDTAHTLYRCTKYETRNAPPPHRVPPAPSSLPAAHCSQASYLNKFTCAHARIRTPVHARHAPYKGASPRPPVRHPASRDRLSAALVALLRMSRRAGMRAAPSRRGAWSSYQLSPVAHARTSSRRWKSTRTPAEGARRGETA